MTPTIAPKSSKEVARPARKSPPAIGDKGAPNGSGVESKSSVRKAAGRSRSAGPFMGPNKNNFLVSGSLLESYSKMKGEKDALVEVLKDKGSDAPKPRDYRSEMEQLISKSAFDFRMKARYLDWQVGGSKPQFKFSFRERPFSLLGGLVELPVPMIEPPKSYMTWCLSKVRIKNAEPSSIKVCDLDFHTGRSLCRLLLNSSTVFAFWNLRSSWIWEPLTKLASSFLFFGNLQTFPHVLSVTCGPAGTWASWLGYYQTWVMLLSLFLKAARWVVTYRYARQIFIDAFDFITSIFSYTKELRYEVVGIDSVLPQVVPSFDEESIQIERDVAVCDPVIQYNTCFGSCALTIPDNCPDYDHSILQNDVFKQQFLSLKLLPELVNQKTLLASARSVKDQEINRLIRLAENCGVAQDDYTILLDGRDTYLNTLRFGLMRIVNRPIVPSLN